MVFGIYKTPESVEQSWGDLKTGDIPDAIEFEYTRYFCDVGTFALTVPRTTLYADKIEVGSILILHEKEDEYSGFIVKNIKQLNDIIKLTGYDLNVLLADRLTVAQTDDGKDAQSGATETIVKHYVAANCTDEAVDAGRAFPCLVIADDLARGTPNDAAAPRLARVSDTIADILGAAGMGYRVTPLFNSSRCKLEFDVFEAVDRTSAQRENSTVCFAYGHGNVSEMTRETGVTSDRNTFYCQLSDGMVTRYDKKSAVAGEEETAEAAETAEDTEETAKYSGYQRREEYLDLNCELSEIEVYADHQIADRFQETDSLEIVAGNPLDYGTIYNVGDIVTVYDRNRDVQLDSVISAVEIKRTSSEYSVKIMLGSSKPKPLDLLSKGNKATSTIIRQGTMGVGMPSSWDCTSEYFNNYSQNVAGTRGYKPYYAHAEGSNTKALGVCSHAEGNSTTASGLDAHTEGDHTTASGSYAHAEGSDTTASGSCAHAEGTRTTASGPRSHAEGYGTTASGEEAHAEGNSTTASGSYAHAEGISTSVSGNYCHVEGGYNAIDGGVCSHVEGRENNVKSPETSHVSGARNVAKYINYSTVSGENNTVTSCYHTCVNGYKNTVSNAYQGFVAGENNVVGGNYNSNLTAIGYKLMIKNTNNSAAAVFGQYNQPDPKLLFSVGNGINDDMRSNAFAVDAAGNVYISGDIYINGVKLEFDSAQGS